VDHFLIEHDGSALTCSPESVTVTACASADCSTLYTGNLDVTLSPSGWVGGDTRTLTGGSASFRLRHTTAGAVTLGANSTLPAPANPTVCATGSGSSCEITFHDSGFIFSIADGPSCSEHSATIAAVRKDDATEQCVGLDSFANSTRPVAFWSSYVNPNTGSRQIDVNGAAVATAAPGTTLNLTFDASAQAPLSVTYDDAGRVQLDALFTGSGEEAGLSLAGSDRFVAYPDHFAVKAFTVDGGNEVELNNATTGGAPVWMAGAPFRTRVTAVCADGSTTPDFTWPTTLAATAPFAPAAGNLGAFVLTGSPALDLYPGGSEEVSGHYTEVGNVTLAAAATNYLGTGRDITGSTLAGRFRPDHFTTTTNSPQFRSGCGLFTYLGQPFDYVTAPQIAVTAVNRQGATTANYTGNWWKMGDGDIGSTYAIDSGTLVTTATTGPDVTDTGGGHGTIDFGGSLSVARDSLVAPADAEIRLRVNVQDGDGVTATAPVDFGATTAGNGIAFSGGRQMRFGRLRLFNAFGPELFDLPLPLWTEYWDGTGFVLNADDNCTPYAHTDVTLGSFLGNLAAGETAAAGSGTITGGRGANLRLTAPGAGHDGSVDATLAVPAWLRYDWDGVDQGGDGNLYDDDPTARATFGIYQGNPRLIYRRESVGP